jgi:hypothetical protein
MFELLKEELKLLAGSWHIWFKKVEGMQQSY